MKKDKIFNLEIDEFDEFSGIDSVSLVEDPAIEIQWLAFNDQKKLQEFHIPDGQDEYYLSRIIDKGQTEQELLEEGWEIYMVEPMGQNQFGLTTTPNDVSEKDTDEVRVRYKYGLNPKISGQSEIISTTREWCRVLCNRNKVYRYEDILSLQPDMETSGGDVLQFRGGYNCRHWWFKVTYKPTGKIRNNATITINREKDDAGRSSNLPVDWEQGQTLNTNTINAIREGRNKTNNLDPLAFEDVSLDIFGYKPRYFHMCPGAVETFKHLVSMDVDDDTVGMIRSAAQVSDNVFRIEEEVIKSEVATPDQLLQASILVQDFKDIIHEIDEETGMLHDVSYMDGHIEKIKGYVKEELDYVNNLPSFVDQITTGITKADFEEVYDDYPDSIKNNAKSVLKWVEENGWGDCLTPVGKKRANDLAKGRPVSLDTVKRMYSYLSRHEKDLESSKSYEDGCGKLAYDSWGGKTALAWAEGKVNAAKNKMSKEKFEIENEEKRTIVGVAMVPDKLILRYDRNREPYYVKFSAEEIAKISRKYMRNKYTDNNDLDHDGKAVRDVYVIESWIVEDEQYDKSRKYGFDVRVGSWMIMMKVAETPKGDLVWERVKKGELNGFSVSGYFAEVPEYTKEDMFIQKVLDILKSVDD